jgi:endonuclease YncB( thermonuclease family)
LLPYKWGFCSRSWLVFALKSFKVRLILSPWDLHLASFCWCGWSKELLQAMWAWKGALFFKEPQSWSF